MSSPSPPATTEAAPTLTYVADDDQAVSYELRDFQLVSDFTSITDNQLIFKVLHSNKGHVVKTIKDFRGGNTNGVTDVAKSKKAVVGSPRGRSGGSVAKFGFGSSTQLKYPPPELDAYRTRSLNVYNLEALAAAYNVEYRRRMIDTIRDETLTRDALAEAAVAQAQSGGVTSSPGTSGDAPVDTALFTKTIKPFLGFTFVDSVSSNKIVASAVEASGSSYSDGDNAPSQYPVGSPENEAAMVAAEEVELAPGVYVAHIFKGGSAEQVGVESGSRLLRIGGQDITSVDDVTSAVFQFCHAGQFAVFEFEKGGEEQVVDLWIMTRDEEYKDKPFYYDAEAAQALDSNETFMGRL